MASAPPAGSSSPGNLAPPATSAELKEHYEQRHVALLKRYSDEGTDSRWSVPAQKAIAANLTTVGANAGFQVGRVECRTTMCTASVEWPSYVTVRKTYAQILHAPLSVACAREVYVPEPDHPDAPYSTTVVLSCEEERVRAK